MSLLNFKCEITVTNKKRETAVIDFTTSFDTNESYEHLTDTLKLTFPRRLLMRGRELFTGTNPMFERGDAIELKAGYFPNMRSIFKGFISKVAATLPVELECEDEMWQFKQYTVTYPKKVTKITLSKRGKPLKRPKIISGPIKLSELIGIIVTEDFAEPVLIDGDINLGQFRVTNATPAQVFEKLRSEYGLYCYFVDEVLHIGFAANASTSNEETFILEEVVFNYDDLDYQKADDVRMRVVAISMNPNNTKTQVEVGDPDGEQRTIHKYDMNEAELKLMATKWLAETKYNGFTGKILTLGEPYLRHGDRIKLVSEKLPELNSVYLVKTVARKCGPTLGYRQEFELGAKVG